MPNPLTTEWRYPDPEPPDNPELGLLTAEVLACPADDTVRKALADWLDEHAQPHRAKYLREIRRHKFVKLSAQIGWAALYPLPQMPPRVADMQRYWQEPPPERSARCRAWLLRVKLGWRMPKWLGGVGYYGTTQYFGVYLWEWFNVLGPTYAPDWFRNPPVE